MEEKIFSILVLFIVLFLSPSVQSVEEVVEKFCPCKFKAIYTFGDSNSDTGSGFATFYQAGTPCGETYFHRPASRGSDGRLIIDFIADHNGLPFLSGYLDSVGSDFRHGANFACGGATIRPQNEPWPSSGVSPFSLDIQVIQFNQFKERSNRFHDHTKYHWKRNLPKPEEFSTALYVIDMGMNDIAAAFRKLNETERHAAVPDMVDQLANAVQNLYWGGARTFWIHNTGPYGCIALTLNYNLDPSELDHQGCVKDQNELAMEFNKQLKERVTKLRTDLADSSITYVDIYSAKYELIGNAKREGFVEAKGICCGVHNDSVHVYCGNKATVNGTEIYAGSCEDPSKYISWDGVHYTEAANHWVAARIINGSYADPPLPIKYACHA